MDEAYLKTMTYSTINSQVKNPPALFLFYIDFSGVLISSNSQPILKNNRIFGGKAAGIEVTNNGGGVIENNEVFDNSFDGICLATGVNPFMSGIVI